MIGAEILLLVIGVVFYIASFFITEKLGPFFHLLQCFY